MDRDSDLYKLVDSLASEASAKLNAAGASGVCIMIAACTPDEPLGAPCAQVAIRTGATPADVAPAIAANLIQCRELVHEMLLHGQNVIAMAGDAHTVHKEDTHI